MRLLCRRFYCRSPECSRRIFTERIPKVVRRYGRFTERSRQVLSLIGYALGGEAGARLAEHIGLETSADTVLRTLKSYAPEESHPPVRAIGVDDWAWRKGQHYGTILVDLERHKVVGLLPERSAESLAQWLKNEPSVEVVTRDRAGLYAEGATKGAPEAVQVADRFHLLCNLTAAAERALHQTRFAGVIPPPPYASIVVESGKIVPLSQADQLKGQRRERRLERYNEVTRLYREGHSQKAISDLLGIQRKTIRRLLRTGEFPERSRPKRKPSRVDQFRSFLERRWAKAATMPPSFGVKSANKAIAGRAGWWHVWSPLFASREQSISAPTPWSGSPQKAVSIPLPAKSHYSLAAGRRHYRNMSRRFSCAWKLKIVASGLCGRLLKSFRR